ncbi:hypothetical protein PENSTE_c011G03372 [Penicillium steckii]|uniref:Transcription factor domain-containing protein n=1 Tax=Penicillium steckii TaxID=303698 RepID=A0A1V6T5Y7_9EURO|nr:hypothetical protein PENSTE_c011G03372 [Penicillium steckii]
MGLPLDESGHLAYECIRDSDQETKSLQALVRLLSKLITLSRKRNKSMTEWNSLELEITEWYNVLPPAFRSSITQPLPTPIDEIENPSEIWFASDTCAIVVSFYHMARILLHLNRPKISNSRSNKKRRDKINANDSVQWDLSYHSRQIMSIAH